MARFDLTDFEWSVIQPLLPNKPRGVGVGQRSYELVAVHGALGMLDQGQQQVEFPLSDVDGLVVGVVELAIGDVETPAGELGHLTAIGLGAGLGRCGAAQHRLDTGSQLTQAEGFDDIVIGPHFQANDAVDLGGPAGQHDDRHR